MTSCLRVTGSYEVVKHLSAQALAYLEQSHVPHPQDTAACDGSALVGPPWHYIDVNHARWLHLGDEGLGCMGTRLTCEWCSVMLDRALERLPPWRFPGPDGFFFTASRGPARSAGTLEQLAATRVACRTPSPETSTGAADWAALARLPLEPTVPERAKVSAVWFGILSGAERSWAGVRWEWKKRAGVAPMTWPDGPNGRPRQ